MPNNDNDNEPQFTAGWVWLNWSCPACNYENTEEDCRGGGMYKCHNCGRMIEVVVD